MHRSKMVQNQPVQKALLYETDTADKISPTVCGVGTGPGICIGSPKCSFPCICTGHAGNTNDGRLVQQMLKITS